MIQNVQSLLSNRSKRQSGSKIYTNHIKKLKRMHQIVVPHWYNKYRYEWCWKNIGYRIGYSKPKSTWFHIPDASNNTTTFYFSRKEDYLLFALTFG